MYNKIKHISVTTFLFVIWLGGASQAMMREASSPLENLTEKILQQENDAKKNGKLFEFESDKGLVYKKAGSVIYRINHILEHIPESNDPNNQYLHKDLHAVFDLDIEAHKDIIRFIDTIFEKFENKGINTKDDTRTPKGSPKQKGSIELHGLTYEVSDNFNGTDHYYYILPVDKSSSLVTGEQRGRCGNNSVLRGYELKFRNIGGKTHIFTIFPK